MVNNIKYTMAHFGVQCRFIAGLYGTEIQIAISIFLAMVTNNTICFISGYNDGYITLETNTSDQVHSIRKLATRTSSSNDLWSLY